MGKSTTQNSLKAWIALFIAVAVFFGGILIGVAADRQGGTVSVQDVYYTSTIDGSLMHGRLYIPDTATAANPAPAVIFMQGNDGESEKYSMLAIEFARRGYVAYSGDLRGQGKSVGLTGFKDAELGGYDSLGANEAGEYVRALPFVDADQIVIGGHSMGGVAAIRSAHDHLDWYTSLFVMGCTAADCGISSDNTNLGPKAFDKNASSQMEAEDKMLPLIGDEENINILIVTGRDDGDAFNHSGVTLFCGLEDEADFVSGQVYGSYETGNARVNYQAPVIHNWEYMSTRVLTVTLDFIQNSISAPNPIESSSQVWQWRYIGTSIALVAMIAILFPLGTILLRTPFFASIATAEPEYRGARGKKWWIFAVIAAAVAPALYFFGCNHSKWIDAVKIWNISRVNCTLSWTLIVAAVTVVILLVTTLTVKKAERVTYESLGLSYSDGSTGKNIAKAFLLAFLMIFAVYALLAVQYRWTLVDVRIWNTSFRELNLVRVGRVLRYFIPFCIAYLIMSVNLYGTLRPAGGTLSVGKEMLINIAIQSPWYFVWAIWLGTGGLARNGGLPSFAGSMYAFFWAVPLMMAIIAAVSTYFNRKTGHVYLGSFLSAWLICWTLLGGLSRLV